MQPSRLANAGLCGGSVPSCADARARVERVNAEVQGSGAWLSRLQPALLTCSQGQGLQGSSLEGTGFCKPGPVLMLLGDTSPGTLILVWHYYYYSSSSCACEVNPAVAPGPTGFSAALNPKPNWGLQLVQALQIDAPCMLEGREPSCCCASMCAHSWPSRFHIAGHSWRLAHAIGPEWPARMTATAPCRLSCTLNYRSPNPEPQMACGGQLGLPPLLGAMAHAPIMPCGGSSFVCSCNLVIGSACKLTSANEAVEVGARQAVMHPSLQIPKPERHVGACLAYLRSCSPWQSP